MSCAALTSCPPSRAQANQCLYPEVVSRLTRKNCGSEAHFFATAVLLDSRGSVVEALDGTKAVTGVVLDSSNVTFTFSDLVITLPGVYTIRLDMYAMSPEDAAGANLVAQLETNPIATYWILSLLKLAYERETDVKGI